MTIYGIISHHNYTLRTFIVGFLEINFVLKCVKVLVMLEASNEASITYSSYNNVICSN